MQRQGSNFQDLKELGWFIASLWGALALVSVGLAFLNGWLGFIPRHPTLGTIATVLALLAAGFAFLYSYVEGETASAFDDPTGYRRASPNPRRPTLGAAFGRFAWAVLALAVYLTLLSVFGLVDGNRDAGAALVAAALGPILLVIYAATFGFLTAALGTLAVVHHLAARRSRAPAALPASEDEERTRQIFPFDGFEGSEDDDGRLTPELRIDRARW